MPAWPRGCANFARVPVRQSAQRIFRATRPDVARASGRAIVRSRAFPVRIAYPAQTGESSGVPPSAVAGLEISGLDGTGVTVALLDTGVDPSHPYLRRSILSGVDVISPGSGGVAQPHPTIPGRPERHATELAGIITGSDGPGGLHGIAPGASILPVRVAGWQPNTEGGYTVYSRTDQISPAWRRVDPNDDGDTHDAARIALIGVVEPMPRSRMARWRAPSQAQPASTAVVVPAGNDGRAGRATAASPAPAGHRPPSLSRPRRASRAPTVRVQVRAGLRFSSRTRCRWEVRRRGGDGRGRSRDPRSGRAGDRGLFMTDGISAVAGRAALLPKGRVSEETGGGGDHGGCRSRARGRPATRRRVQPRRPGRRSGRGLPDRLVRRVRAMLAAGVPVTVAVGAVDMAENDAGGSVAAFSSQGLAFGGGLKPDLVAPGVAVPTSEPGRGEEGEVRFGTVSGTSAPRPWLPVRPRSSPRGARGLERSSLVGLLVGSAQRRDLDAAASGAGLLDLRAAVQQEFAAEPACLVRSPAAKLSRARAKSCASATSRPASSRSRSGRGARAEGRRDHGRPATAPTASRAQRDGRRAGGHKRPVRPGRRCNGRAGTRRLGVVGGARALGGRGAGPRTWISSRA